MDPRTVLTGLGPGQSAMLGDPRICVAVLDGPVDLSPRFAGADVRRLDTLVQDPAGQGPMSVHGTHVTSLIFSQPDGSRHSPTTGRRRPDDAARTSTSEDATQPAEWMREAKPPEFGVLSKGDQS